MGRRRDPNPSAKTLRQREWRERVKRRKAEERAAAMAAARNANVTPADLIEWIEGELKVPTGPLAGQPFRVPDWQAEWITGALQPGVREAGLSISRKNGKSGLIGAVLLGGLVGPLNRSGWRGVVTSLRGALAKELRDAIEQTAAASGMTSLLKLEKAPPPGRLYGRLAARLDFLAADRSTGHAIGADLAIIDEAGLLLEADRELWNAIYSSISGRNGRFWAISIQGRGPMFAEMQDRAELKRPELFWRKWEAPEDCDIRDEAAWHAGNPGLADGIKSIDYMRDMAQRAFDSPGNEADFRALDLNQPVDPRKQTIVSLSQWRRVIDPAAPKLSGDIVLGIDLGGSASMTAAAAYSVDTGAIRVWGAFGNEPELSVRARADRMGSLYDRMLREGELRLYDGTVTPVIPFLRGVMDEISDCGRLVAIGADRYRKAEAEMAFRDAGIPLTRCVWRGQGAGKTADGTADVRAFQKAVLSRTLKTPGSTMLEAAIANSVLRFDPSGNPAIDKAANGARIDALSAAVIAVGIAQFMDAAPLLKVSVV